MLASRHPPCEAAIRFCPRTKSSADFFALRLSSLMDLPNPKLLLVVLARVTCPPDIKQRQTLFHTKPHGQQARQKEDHQFLCLQDCSHPLLTPMKLLQPPLWTETHVKQCIEIKERASWMPLSHHHYRSKFYTKSKVVEIQSLKQKPGSKLIILPCISSLQAGFNFTFS